MKIYHGGWFTGIQSIMDSFNKNNLGFCHRPISTSFLDTMVNIIKSIDDLTYGKPSFEEPKKEFEKNGEKELKSIIDLFSTSDPLSFEWLMIKFNVNIDNIMRLSFGRRSYNGETSRSGIRNIVVDIAEDSPMDYTIIRSFFLYRKTQFMIMLYPLPVHITKQQIESYHRMYQTLRGEKLSESAGVYYVCPNCGELKARVMPKDLTIGPSSHIKERERTLSNEKTSINMQTGKVYCSKPPSKTTPKKRTVATDTVCEMIGAEKDSKKETKKQSKDNRKKSMRQNCPQTELVKINMIGKILRTEKTGLVIVCPWCLCLTTFGRFSYENSGGHLSCGCKRETPLIDYPCAICKKLCTTTKQLRFYFVYDDERKKPCMCYIGICKDHKQTKWIQKWEETLCLSKIREAIENKWTSMPFDDGKDRVFVDSNKKQKRY